MLPMKKWDYFSQEQELAQISSLSQYLVRTVELVEREGWRRGRQTDRHTYRHTERETDRQTDR